MFKQLLNAIGFMHLNGVVHRDLQPHNILLDKEGINLKVTDFNVSKLCKKSTQTNKFIYKMLTHTGTLAYVAPETIGSSLYK